MLGVDGGVRIGVKVQVLRSSSERRREKAREWVSFFGVSQRSRGREKEEEEEEGKNWKKLSKTILTLYCSRSRFTSRILGGESAEGLLRIAMTVS